MKTDKNNNNQHVTPMMEQYLELKEQARNYLLFYRMGDFYELFFEDAVKASNTLDIALTKRGKHLGKDIPMCGVPVNSHEVYLSRLIKKGFKVAVCEQTEDPREAKKRGSKAVVKREVIRIITPGTITEENLLESTKNNYLVAVAKAEGKLGVAWLDMTTGELKTQTSILPSLSNTLARLDAGEILISEKLLDQKEWAIATKPWEKIITSLPETKFDSISGQKFLLDAYKVQSLKPFGAFSKGELSSAGALIDYLNITQKGNLPRLLPPTQVYFTDILEIDSATRYNLELTTNQKGLREGSLLSTIDKTLTASGARELSSRLSSPLTNTKEIRGRLDSVEYFTNQHNTREDIRRFLKQYPDVERALSRVTANRGGPRDLAIIRKGLSVVNSILSLFSTRKLPAPLKNTICGLDKHSELLNELQRALKEELPVYAKDGGYIASKYDPKLDELFSLRDKSRKLVTNLQAEYAVDTGVQNLKIKYNGFLGYFIEVSNRNAPLLDASNNVNFIHRQSMRNAVRFSTAELKDLEGQIASAAERAVELELAHFSNLVHLVNSHSKEIARTAKSVAILDVETALAQLAQDQNLCKPHIDDSLDFNVVKGRHPVVESALRVAPENQENKRFMPNDCSLELNSRLWLITGPNMAGKSTFLRQNALIAVLAQMGSFVPAKKVRFGKIDRLFSRVGAADNLARGHSTFMSEMLETASILLQATERSFVILDEIGRGTATFDGLSIAWAVVEHLHEINHCRGLFATHYHELTSLAKKLSGLSCHSMQVKEWKNDVVFLHTVEPGIADKSYGIHVGRLAGLPSSVVRRAQEVLTFLERNNSSDKNAQLGAELPLFNSLENQNQVNSISPIEEKLLNVSPDNLSPKEALDLIYHLKNLLNNH